MSLKDFLILIVMTVPALLAAKLVSVGIIDAVVRGFYRGARLNADETYFFLTQFISCVMASLVFVWIGSRPRKDFRWFSVWFLAGLSIAAAIGLGGTNGPLGFIGQILGAIAGAIVFRK